MAHVAKWKKEVVGDFSSLLSKYPIIGIVNLENLPTSQLQQMREQLRGQVEIKMTKKRLIRKAFEESKGKVNGIEKLEPFLEGMPAVLLTKENPFKLYKILQKSKSTAPAKAGQKAPRDVLVPKGPTSFAPGPIIGELGAVGIKAGIDAGKVAVKEDKIVLKEGEVFSDKLASILLRLGIQPMEIGLNLTAVLEGGAVFGKNVLAVDEKEYVENITKLARESFNLAVEIAYPTKDTTEFLVQKSFKEAKALSIEAGVFTKETIGDMLSRSQSQMLSVAENLPAEAKDGEF